MALSTRLSAAMGRIGTEFKAVRSSLATVEGYAKRWEQEILVTAGRREIGTGEAAFGIYIPYNITIKGAQFQFTTPTPHTTTGKLYEYKNNNFIDTNIAMNIPPEAMVQKVTGVSAQVSAGSRLLLSIESVGPSDVGDGLYMALWGEYR